MQIDEAFLNEDEEMKETPEKTQVEDQMEAMAIISPEPQHLPEPEEDEDQLEII